MEFLPDLSLTDTIVIFIVGVIMALVAALLIGIGLYSRQKVKASQSWPSAPGRVLGSGVETSSGSEGGTVYRPVIRYSYMVGGQEYHNNRRVFGDTTSSGDRRGAERTAARFVVGSAVPVYYNPANPQDAVLERKSGVAGLMFGIGGLLLLLGCGLPVCGLVLYFNSLVIPIPPSSLLPWLITNTG
jgi:hypothetical protein